MSFHDKDALIENILMRTLGDLAGWKPSILIPGVGPQHPQVHSEFKARLESYRNNVRSMLNLKSLEELRSDYLFSDGSSLNPLTKINGIHFEFAKELQSLKHLRPPWFGGGWSVQSNLIDVDYWAAAKKFDIEEAALLLVGVDPRTTIFGGLFAGYGDDRRTNDVLYFLEDNFELLVRRFGDPERGPVSIEADELYAWISETDLKVSFQLKTIVNHRLGNGAHTSARHSAVQPKKPHGRTRAMFQRALLVVAIEKYGLKKAADAGKTANLIVSAGDFLGFRLDLRTLVNDLRAGYEQLSEISKSDISKKM